MKRKRSGNRSQKRRGGATVGYWAVAYLDLLGYRQLLRSADAYPLPTFKGEQDALFRKVVRPYHFRRRLLGVIETFQESTRSPGAQLRHLPPDAQKLAARLRAIRIKTYAIGDSVAMEMPLRPDLSHFPPRAIDTVFTAICSAVLMQLYAGADDPEDTLPLRGGVDVGTGAEFGGILYSAALAKAVQLEDEADFPRVLVGDRLIEFLDLLAATPGSDVTSQVARAMGNQARGFVFQDPTDQKWCVDFLGAAFQRRTQLPATLVQSAWVYVQKALALHAECPRLLRKYQWLESYMKARLSLWNIQP